MTSRESKPFVALIDLRGQQNAHIENDKKQLFSIVQMKDPCNNSISNRQYLTTACSGAPGAKLTKQDIYEVQNIPHAKSNSRQCTCTRGL